MDKSSNPDPISDAIAWAETGRKQSEDKLRAEQEAFQKITFNQYLELRNRVDKLEKLVGDNAQLVFDHILKLTDRLNKLETGRKLR